MHFCYYKITITYSGNPLPNNNATIYTKPKPAHSYKSSSSNYDSMGDSGSKIISSDPPNVENEHKKDKNLFQERQSLNYNSTASGHKSSEAITFANQMSRPAPGRNFYCCSGIPGFGRGRGQGRGKLY